MRGLLLANVIAALTTSVASAENFDARVGPLPLAILISHTGYLSDPDPRPPTRVAMAFVRENLDALGLTAADLGGFEVTDLVPSAVTGATHIYLRQRHAGLSVYQGQLAVHVNRDGRILSVNSAFVADLAQTVNERQAALAAPQGCIDLMWLPVAPGETRLVWYCEDGKSESTIDAATGQVWTRFTWIHEAEYRVYPVPIESPIHTTPLPPSDARVLEVDPQHPERSPLGWHDDGTTARTITRGNNVHAYEDRDGNGQPPSAEVTCGPDLSCNFAIDLTVNPPGYITASVTNLFYWNNVIHDVMYGYGFDEPGGNFQVTNFGKGGLGNDDVRAEAQDNDIAGSNCNANMLTPPDGSRPRMQMFTCNRASPERDGDLDDLVIMHEYAHGISNRLVGGPTNVGCLGNLQQPGEGWSDWYGLVITHQAGFTGADARGVGSYLFNLPAQGGTIRPFPYSTDFAINDDTYSRIAVRARPHGIGSVWAEIIWEVYWDLIARHGFDPDLYNATGGAGNQRAMLYATEGMKLTRCRPTFLDARDAMILAALDNDPADVCPMWESFARRGLGVDATTPGPDSREATDGFEIPAECQGRPQLCGDTFPLCNGTCPAGEDCVDTGTACVCMVPPPPACGDTFPTCDGVCPIGEDCIDTGTACQCELPPPPSCGETFPVCDGVCPIGEDCVTTETACVCMAPPPPDCTPKHGFCADDGECCSQKCRGPRGRKRCRGPDRLP